MFTITVPEAAKMLHVSVSRVHQLIQNGALAAEKVGGRWLVDAKSIDARQVKKPQAGRPSTHSSQQTTTRFTLMNRTHEVLTFRFDRSTGDFFDIEEIADPARAPFAIMSPRGKTASKEALSYWWAHRTIPKGRTGLEAKLRELEIAEPYDLPFKSLGLSLSDQYWIRPANSSLKWEDVNFFTNDFIETEAGGWLADVGLDSPDNTSEGMLSKRWVCRGGKRLLLKGGTLLEQEPFNEAIATNLCGRLMGSGEYVAYEVGVLDAAENIACETNLLGDGEYDAHEVRVLGADDCATHEVDERDGQFVSSCQTFVTSEEEFIPAYYIRLLRRQSAHHNDYQHYVECCAELGVLDIEDALSKMILCDYIMANTDRHWRNFGLIRNVETLEYRVAPLFDTGTSLWCHIPTRELQYALFMFESKPFFEDANRQLRLIGDTSWIDFAKLADFPEWAADFLLRNPSMHGRTDFVCEGIDRNLESAKRILG